MYCSKCGNKLKEDSKFCSKCGKKIDVTRQENKISEKKIRFLKFDSSRKKLISVIIIVMALSGLGLFYSIFTNKLNDYSAGEDKKSAAVNDNSVTDTDIDIHGKKNHEYIYVIKNDNNKYLCKENEYNERGDVIKSQAYHDGGKIMSKSDHLYDEKGLLIKSESYDYDSEGHWTEEYEYDENGNNILITSNDGEYVFKHEYIYDDRGNEIRYINYDSAGEGHISYDKQYDMDNNMIKETIYNDFGSVMYYTNYKYNNGCVVEEAKYDVSDYKDDELEELTVYEYDQQKNLVQEKTYNISLNPDMTTYWLDEYAYDENGNQIMEKKYRPMGEVYIWNEYVFDQNNNMIEHRVLDEFGNITSKDIYTYDEYGRIVLEETYVKNELKYAKEHVWE